MPASLLKARRIVAGLSATSLLTAGIVVGINSSAQAAVTIMTPYGSSTHQAKNPSQCGDILFIGVRGSDEKDVSGSPKVITFGQTVQRVRDALRDNLNAYGSKLRIRQTYLDSNDYPAVKAEKAVLDFKAYGNSVIQGASSLEDYIAQQAKTKNCPGEKLFLAGFSQGSQVIDKALADLPKAQIARIAGVYTVANPWNFPTDKFVHDGSAKVTPTTPTGIFSADLNRLNNVNEYLGGRPKIPASLGFKAISFCVATDPMCNYLDAGSALAVLTAADDLHGKAYYRNNDIYTSMLALSAPIAYAELHPTAAPTTAPTRTSTPAPTPTPTPTSTASTGVIPDPQLRSCVVAVLKSQLNITTTAPTATQMAQLKTLDCSPYVDSLGYNAYSLEGLQYATSLTLLNVSAFSSTGYSELTFVTKMPSLVTLIAQGDFHDPSPLLDNKTIKTLTLGNHVQDPSALATMTSLKSLNLDNNNIIDISGIRSLFAPEKNVAITAKGQYLGVISGWNGRTILPTIQGVSGQVAPTVDPTYGGSITRDSSGAYVYTAAPNARSGKVNWTDAAFTGSFFI